MYLIILLGLNPKPVMFKYNMIFYFERLVVMGSEYIPLYKFLCTFITVT